MNKEVAIKKLLYQKISTSAWGKLYDAKLFRNIFYPKGKQYEDVETTYSLFNSSNIIVHSSMKLYAYYQRSGSIVGDRFSIKKMDYHVNTYSLYERVSKDYPDLRRAALSRLLWTDVHLICKIGNKSNDFSHERELLWNEIKSNRLAVLLDGQIRVQNRCVLLLSFLGRRILCCIYDFQNIRR
jgi:hypothetical protein